MAGGDDLASPPRRLTKSPGAFRTISEVATELDVPPHVLRFWESKFTQIRPLKRGGRRRYYRPEDVELLRRIRGLLYTDGYTIRGVQKVLRERGVKGLVQAERRGAEPGDGEKEAAPAPGTGLSDGQRAEIEAALDELNALKDMLEKARR